MFYLEPPIEPDYPSEDEIIAQYVFECEEYALRHFNGISDAIESMLEQLYCGKPDELIIDAAAHYLSDMYDLENYIRTGESFKSLVPQTVKVVK